jgi:hypothetical protein
MSADRNRDTPTVQSAARLHRITGKPPLGGRTFDRPTGKTSSEGS